MLPSIPMLPSLSPGELLVLLLLAFCTTPPHVTANLVSFDRCLPSIKPGCLPPRYCADATTLDLNPPANCTTASDECICVTPNGKVQNCTTSADCIPGEGCVRLRPENTTFCMGCTTLRVVWNSPGGKVRPVDPEKACPTASPTPRPPGGHTLDACETDSHCVSRLRCNPLKFAFKRSCLSPGVPCFCFPPGTDIPALCQPDMTCPSGETCVLGLSQTDALVDRPRCVSDTVAKSTVFQAVVVGTSPSIPPLPSTSPTPTPFGLALPSPSPVSPFPSRQPLKKNPGQVWLPPICIAASHLASFPPTDLVFRTHHIATVLCDSAGSCATPAHLVTVHGTPMTMRSYCATRATRATADGCTTREMAVNSPRMRRGRRVQTPSDGLLFTPLAARFESRGEELFLRLLVVVGF